MKKLALVTGASSQLGIFLLPQLRDAGFEVLAFSRKAPDLPLEAVEGVNWVHPDYLDGQQPDAIAVAPPAPVVLISCGPLELACELVEKRPAIRRVVAFSTSSIISKKNSVDRQEKALISSIASQEQRLRKMCHERGLPLLLLRPTLIYGCGMDSNVSLLRKLAQRFGAIPLAGAAAGLRQPVHADDLASLALGAVERAAPVNLASEVCGGSTLSYREMAEGVAASCSRKVRLLTVPPGLLAAAVNVLSLLPPWKGLTAEMVKRQSKDLLFDDSALRKALSYDPRPFQPGPQDFKVPNHAKRLQLPSY